MSDPAEDFFAELAHHGRERLLRKTTGTIRFDITHDHGVDHWFVSIDRGEIWVSKGDRDADTVIRTDQEVFGRMVRGEVKPLPAWVRNDIVSEGHFGFVVLLERLLPPPPGAHHPKEFARERRQRR